MRFNTSKKHKITVIVLIMLLSITLMGCTGEPKYTYEEYKKIKALSTEKETESIPEDKLEEDDASKDELQYFSDDLDDYNSYINEFTSIYDKYTDELFVLFDSFDNEQEDIDKKNQYANSIIDYEEKWIVDLNEIGVPDFLKKYHEFFIDFLNNEILYYTYFLEADLNKADISVQKADDSYGESLIELEAVKENFNSRAEQLNFDPPF